jgi:PKD repeat protein
MAASSVGLFGLSGKSIIENSAPVASASSEDYKNHHQSLANEHGDVIGGDYTTGSDLRLRSNSPPVCKSKFDPSCGGGSDTTTDDGGDDGGGGDGGGGGSTPKPNDGPSAEISADSHVAVQTSISFSGGNSSDSDGYITSYDWDFGDGSTASGENVSHAYSSPGRYTVSLTVQDDDGASDTVTEEVTVGNQWQISLDFDDGTTVAENALEIGDGKWQTTVDGQQFTSNITQSVIDAVDDFLGNSLANAQSRFEYPSIESPQSVSMNPDSEYKFSGDDFSNGKSWVGGFLPDWVSGTLPAVERAYADWETGGLVEAASQTIMGGTFGMSCVCAEFEPRISSTTMAIAEINYDWSTHLYAIVGSGELIVSPFVRNTTTGASTVVDDKNYDKELFTLDLSGDVQLPGTWYDSGSESISISMDDNSDRDLRLKDGHKYQVGLRLILNSAAYDLSPATSGGRSAADPSTEARHPAGNEDLIHGSFEPTNGVNINNVKINL